MYKIAQRGLPVQTYGRPSGRPGGCRGLPRDGGGRQPREGAGCGEGRVVVTRPPVSSPVRDDLVSGGGWDVAGLLLRDPGTAPSLQTVPLSRGLGKREEEWTDNPRVEKRAPCSRNQETS